MREFIGTFILLLIGLYPIISILSFWLGNDGVYDSDATLSISLGISALIWIWFLYANFVRLFRWQGWPFSGFFVIISLFPLTFVISWIFRRKEFADQAKAADRLYWEEWDAKRAQKTHGRGKVAREVGTSSYSQAKNSPSKTLAQQPVSTSTVVRRKR